MPVHVTDAKIPLVAFQRLINRNPTDKRLMNILHNKKWFIISKYKIRSFRSNNPKNINNYIYLQSRAPRESYFYKTQIKSKFPIRIFSAQKIQNAWKNYQKRRIESAQKIKNAWKNYKSRINSPSKRTSNNPTWVATFNRQRKAFNRTYDKSKQSNKLPNIPRSWGLWYGPYENGIYKYENGSYEFNARKNTLTHTRNGVVYTNARKKFHIPF